MADYFLSDVHLRHDRPDRGERLARLVDGLGPADRLFVVGDLCDFWFASRQHRRGLGRCPGLRSLVAFRERGGELILMLGNHDAWLGPFYEANLGVGVRPEPLELESYGRRLRLAHGHRVKGKSWWKGAMEGRAFLRAFGLLPRSLAWGLEALLDRVNERGRAESERRMIAGYREAAESARGGADLLIFGHVHRVVDETTRGARFVVLGDWLVGASYLRIDEREAALRRGVPGPARPDGLRP